MSWSYFMHWIDLLIFVIYALVMLGIGFFFLRTNQDTEDYYVGGRNMGSFHVGLSVVATDVGGGFSIGLGGLGFAMGLSGSWMLFTGLLGAWLSAVFLIPKVSKLAFEKRLLTFPQVFSHYFSPQVAWIAGLISAIGYTGFTSSQMLAGAKLASASFIDLDISTALLIMGVIAVVYTVMGGLKAVIFTDSVQWAILMGGLIFIGLPIAFYEVGGWAVIKESLPPGHLSFAQLDVVTAINWLVTIVPIWFVGMTLYQRIYACRSEKEAKKAWFTAGFFEWPIMAIMGVSLGILARVASDQGMFDALGYGANLDSELGLPLLLRQVLPVGLMGLMLSAYFSAILSTADSCLMAASGNLVTDLLGKKKRTTRQELRYSQLATLGIGILALFLASYMTNVLDLMLYSYAFMVSGLFVPVVGILLGHKASPRTAMAAMIAGGGLTLGLILSGIALPAGLDANVFGLSLSALVYFSFDRIFPPAIPILTINELTYENNRNARSTRPSIQTDSLQEGS
jgi:SSS family solute:Na+ symporter